MCCVSFVPAISRRQFLIPRRFLSHISGVPLVSHTFYCTHSSCRALFSRVSSSAILDLQGLHILFVCISLLLQTRCRINIREFRTMSLLKCIHDWRRFIFLNMTMGETATHSNFKLLLQRIASIFTQCIQQKLLFF